jgi:hypothetical protein
LVRDRRNGARSVDTERMECLEVCLHAGATPAVAARDCERDGLLGMMGSMGSMELIDGHGREWLSEMGTKGHSKKWCHAWA